MYEHLLERDKIVQVTLHGWQRTLQMFLETHQSPDKLPGHHHQLRKFYLRDETAFLRIPTEDWIDLEPHQ